MQHLERRIAELSARQHGLVMREQLLALGLSSTAITARLNVGRLHRIHRGVYAVGHAALSPEARLLAAVMRVGRGAAVSHVSAAVLWGLLPADWREARTSIHVISPRDSRARGGIRVHHPRAFSSRDVVRHKGVPVTSVPRTLLDLASMRSISDKTLRRAVREAHVLRLAQAHHIARYLREHANGRRGASRLAALVEDTSPHTVSELEDRTFALLRRHGFPAPEVNAEITTISGTYRADFLWEELRLIVEVDGWAAHGHRVAWEDDAARTAALEAAGYRVVRLTWHQVVDHELDTVARLRAILRQQAVNLAAAA